MKPLFSIPTLFLLSASFVSIDAQDATFQSSSNLVIIDASVRDKAGKVIPDLKKGDFTIFEDGKLQTISVFEFQRLEGDTHLPEVPAVKPAADASAPKSAATPKKAAPAAKTYAATPDEVMTILDTLEKANE